MFSIVIVNWNGEKLLDKCLSSLLNSTYKDFKLFIVDNCSKDNSIGIIKDFSKSMDIELIRLDKNYGFAIANNIAINKAMEDKHEFIITLNNDIEVKEDCLENTRNFILNNRDADVFQMTMINFFDRDYIDGLGIKFGKYLFAEQLGYRDSVENLNNYDIKIDGACAGAAVYSKKSLNQVKDSNGDYFASDFFAYFEDVDLALRLKNNAFKTLLMKDAIVYHMHSATGNKNSSFKEYYLTRNLFLYTRRNLSKEAYRKNKPTYIIWVLRKFLSYLRKGDFANVKSVIKGVNDLKDFRYEK